MFKHSWYSWCYVVVSTNTTCWIVNAATVQWNMILICEDAWSKTHKRIKERFLTGQNELIFEEVIILTVKIFVMLCSGIRPLSFKFLSCFLAAACNGQILKNAHFEKNCAWTHMHTHHHIIINPLTVRVVGAPQMILQPVFSIFPWSPLPSGTCRTPGLSIHKCLKACVLNCTHLCAQTCM